MEFEKVKELVKLVQDSGISELEVTEDGTKIRICSGAAVPASLPHPLARPAATVETPVAAPPAPAAAGRPNHWREIHAPIVGTFFRAPAPGSPPFVEVGARVATGQTLAIIEAMKVMNEIEAEFAGIVRDIVATDGSPVEAEAVLFLIEPA